jgi:TolB-like protein/class 3 adenylate cyclase/Tfp pilus assembly protein PilF
VNKLSDNHSQGKKQPRRLAAIMFTDIVDYSKVTQENENLALELLESHRNILRPIFVKYSGREIETAGDSFFVEFSSAVDAANCAIEIQTALLKRNVMVESEKQIKLRIGLHIGDVVQVGKHVHGDGVNIAARIEPLATPEGICLSEDFARAVRNKLEFPIVKKNEAKLKNISLPMDIYCIQLPWVKEGDLEKVDTKIVKTFVKKTRWYALSIILLVAVTLSIILIFNWDDNENTIQNRIAVLPFVNISKGIEDDYFADGITEEMISNLAKISGLDVIARTSIMKYKDTNLDVSEIGDELNVGTILEGSVRKSDNKTRITVQLIDASTQRHLWAEDYDRELRDIFKIQSEIAMRVAEELKVQLLTNEKEQIVKVGTESPDAYRNYLLGNYYLNKRTGEDLGRSMEYFEIAIRLDPNFAHAYAGLANCYTLIGGAAYGDISREEASEKAKTSVVNALEIDETLAEALTSSAYIKFRFDWDWNEAEKDFRKAIKFKPSYAAAHEWLGLLLTVLGRYDDALKEMKRAYELDPLSASISTGIGRILDFSGRHDEAVKIYNKTLEMYPDYAEAHFAFAMSLTMTRDLAEALNTIDKAIEYSHGRLVMITQKGMIYGFAGERRKALEVLDELEMLSYPDQVSPWLSLSIYLGLEDKDKFFEFANQAYEQRDPLMVYFNVLAEFDPKIRKDSRFNDILKKMDLVE